MLKKHRRAMLFANTAVNTDVLYTLTLFTGDAFDALLTGSIDGRQQA